MGNSKIWNSTNHSSKWVDMMNNCQFPSPVETPVTSSISNIPSTIEQDNSSSNDKLIRVEHQKSSTKQLAPEEDGVVELIQNAAWPGRWITPQPDLSIDYESKQLYHILQGAQQILNVDSHDYSLKQHLPDGSGSSIVDRRNNHMRLSVSLPTVSKNEGQRNSQEGSVSSLNSSRTSATTKRDGRCSATQADARRQRPKTTSCLATSALRKTQQRQCSAAVTRQSADTTFPYKLNKYKPPDRRSVKRDYWQPWNERGKMTKKDTSYVEIHYDDLLPEDDDLKMSPKRFTHNYRHGFHWEIRYKIEEEKPQPKLKKEERIWENEFQMFKLDKLLDKQLSMK